MYPLHVRRGRHDKVLSARLVIARLGALREQSRGNQEKNRESQGLYQSLHHDQAPFNCRY
jgi:hypothetical protein